MLTQEWAQEISCRSHRLIEVETLRLQVFLSAERQKLPCQLRRLLRDSLNLCEVSTRRVVWAEAKCQELGVTRNGGQGVIEVVRHATGQLPHAFESKDVFQLPLELSLVLTSSTIATANDASRS